MTVYIAAPWECRDTAREIRDRLRDEGVTVRATWLDGEQTVGAYDHYSAYALACLDDINAADVLLAYNPDDMQRSGTGGRHIEFGYALARGKRIVMIGSLGRNVFHHLPDIHVVGEATNYAGLLAILRG